MGCLLGCFGSSKNGNRRSRKRQKVQPREQRNAGFNSVGFAVSSVQEYSEKLSSPVPEIQQVVKRDKSEEQLSSISLKKVTFDSNVKTYEPASTEDVPEVSLAKGGEIVKGEDEETSLAKPRQSESHSEDSSITSSSGSYPPNHRYQNCRDSDDELEEEYEESDIDDDEEEDDDNLGEIDYDDLGSRFRVSVSELVIEEIDDSMVTSGLSGREVKINPGARDRSTYVHPVLNPVENLSQWKAVKAKGIPPLKQQKENLRLDEEPRISISSEPSLKESSFSFKSKTGQSKKSNQEIAVDASLSNWLGTSQSTPINKPSTTGLGTITPETSIPMGSNSPSSFEDRPILGALTMEELKQLKQYSASCSPKRSPSHSPDEMPIIGTVGTYWNDNVSKKDSHSAASFKGIPNTTSKYREDKKVKWHSTPFEQRLERALNGGVAGSAYFSHTSNVC